MLRWLSVFVCDAQLQIRILQSYELSVCVCCVLCVFVIMYIYNVVEEIVGLLFCVFIMILLLCLFDHDQINTMFFVLVFFV